MLNRLGERSLGRLRFRPVFFLVFIIAIQPAFNQSFADDTSLKDSATNKSNNGQTHTSEKMRVVGYLPEYRANAIRSEWFNQLTDLILFSAEPSANGTLDISLLSKFPLERLTLLSKQSGTRIILCVGGWGRSEHFGSVCSDSMKRNAFVQSIVSACRQYKFDGIDLDWEHPKNKQEESSYAFLLQDLKNAFKPYGLQLSITMAAWQSLPTEAFEFVDYVQVMAYDHDGRHSTFEGAVKDIEKVKALGAPLSKTILGIPLYGRSTKDRNKTITYDEIVLRSELKPEEDEIDEFYFNGVNTVIRKYEFSVKQGLAGVMFWEIGQDASGKQSILNLLNKRLSAQR